MARGTWGFSFTSPHSDLSKVHTHLFIRNDSREKQRACSESEVAWLWCSQGCPAQETPAIVSAQSRGTNSGTERKSWHGSRCWAGGLAPLQPSPIRQQTGCKAQALCARPSSYRVWVCDSLGGRSGGGHLSPAHGVAVRQRCLQEKSTGRTDSS